MPSGGTRPGAGRPKKAPAPAPAPIISTPPPDRPGATAAAPPTIHGAIAQAKDLTLRLLSELDAVTTHVGELEDLIITETLSDKDERRRKAMLKAIDLPARAGTLKILLAAARAWNELERPKPPAGDKPGKKEQRAAAAKDAAAGRFAPPPPPRSTMQ